MSSDTSVNILEAALAAFDEAGYEATTVALICQRAAVSNGSFFHHFGSKEGVAGALFLRSLVSYHDALLAVLAPRLSARRGVASLVAAHVQWVMEHRAEARFMFEQTRPEWLAPVRARQQAENARFAQDLEQWRQPLVAKRYFDAVEPLVFFSQLVGPAQLLCRAWLASGQAAAPATQVAYLSTCAVRALVLRPTTKGSMP